MMESHLYHSVFMSKLFSRIHMAHIRHKGGILIPRDLSEPHPLGDQNRTTVATMAIALERHVTASVKT